MPEEALAAVLLAGGAPEVVVGWGGEEGGKTAMLEEELVNAMILTCLTVLTTPSGARSAVPWVLRAR